MRHFPSGRIFFQKGKWFHNLIVLMDRMEAVPAPVWMLAAVAGLYPATMAWHEHRMIAGAVTLAALAVEAFVLLRSRRIERSPSPFASPFILFSATHISLTSLAPLLPVGSWIVLGAHLCVQGGLLLAMLYGSLMEPFKVDMRQERVRIGGGGGKSLKIFLLSDLHIDRSCERDEAVLRLARGFGPDLILWPGDVTNLSFVHDPVTREHARELVKELTALAPLYVSLGTAEVDDRPWIESILEGSEAVLLDNKSATVEIGGAGLFLAGVSCQGEEDGRVMVLERLMERADGQPSLLLYHKPDMVEDAARLGVSLYVAGHTHGGQIRLPLYGALYTASRYGRRYAAGTYRVGPTTMIVSRGVGLEGAGAPRMRFLCPPEVVGIELELPAPLDNHSNVQPL